MSDWIDFLHEAGVLQTGSFRLKSGKESPYFLNFGNVDSGLTLAHMGHFFARKILEERLEPTVLFGPAYKGLPISIATSIEFTRITGKDLPYCSFRKEKKQHGDAGMVLGRKPTAEDRIVLMDDVLTTSATKVEGIAELHDFLGTRPNVVAVVVGVDRQERTPEGAFYAAEFTAKTGVPLISLTTTGELLQTLYKRGQIDKSVLEAQ